MGIEAILAIAGLAIPPVVDFIKKKFLKPGQDSPEATISTLATTKPDVIASYTEAHAKLLDSKARYFNRDITGIPSQWIIDLRAAIRPIGVVIAFFILIAMGYMAFKEIYLPKEQAEILTGIRYACIVILSSWFGDRIAH